MRLLNNSRFADHRVVYPRREEGVNSSWVDQFPVIGKDRPEKQNNKLNKTQRTES